MTPLPDRQPLQDLSSRWQRARRAALRAVVKSATGEESEEELLSQALALDPAGAQRGAFDNSLKLGAGFARCFPPPPSLEELPAVLAQLACPCTPGSWSEAEDEPALRLARGGCAFAAKGAAACDYWREALGGLILGMSGVLHARHASRGHGDGACLDVLYLAPESRHRFGPIPAELLAVLDGARRLARRFDSRVEIEFLGLSEGVLYYLEKRGGGDLSVASQLERAVKRSFPGLSLRELSPRPVPVGENSWQTTTG